MFFRSLKFKILFGLIVLALQPLAARAVIDPNSKSIDKLFEVMNMEQAADETIRKTVDFQVNQNPSLKPYEDELLAFVRKNGSFKANKEEIRSLYAEKFSEKEIQDLTEFYSTPTGRKALAVLPELAVEAMTIGLKKAQADFPNFKKAIDEKKAALAK